MLTDITRKCINADNITNYSPCVVNEEKCNSTVKDNLTLLYSNCDSGLLNKRDELNIIISEKNPDIIQLTEIYPKKNHRGDPNTDFHIPGYNLFTNPNPSRGIITYVKSHIGVLPCDIDIVPTETVVMNEYVWTLLKYNSKTMLLGCIYRSGSNDKKLSTNEIMNMLKNIDQSKYDKIIVTGDFN